MDEPNIYDSTSDRGRRIDQGPSNEMDELMEENDDKEQARRDRRGRRADRKGPICRCAPKSKKRTSKLIRSRNPFIIFYLEMYYQNPEKRVTEVAKQAGKEWCAMSDENKKKYIDLAAKERERRGKKRRRGC